MLLSLLRSGCTRFLYSRVLLVRKSVKTDHLCSVMLPVLRACTQVQLQTFFSPTWIRQNRNYSPPTTTACRTHTGVMFKLRADKLQRNFQITKHKLISFLVSTCQQLGPRGLFCDGFLQLVAVEKGEGDCQGCWHQATIVARWSALSTLICRRGRKMSLTTESNVLPVWPFKCTRQHSSMLSAYPQRERPATACAYTQSYIGCI